VSASRAAILRRRAQLFAELAQLELELAGLEEPARVVEAPRPRKKRMAEAPAPPPISADPKVVGLAEERARRALRRAGVPITE